MGVDDHGIVLFDKCIIFLLFTMLETFRLTGRDEVVPISLNSDFTLSPPQRNHQLIFNATNRVYCLINQSNYFSLTLTSSRDEMRTQKTQLHVIQEFTCTRDFA